MAERRTDSTDGERGAWMAAAQAGDRDAYESLLLALLPVLRAFVGRRGVDASAVEDVVQEILLLIHRARHTWQPGRPFDPWMWAIAANATIDALRRQTRERARIDRGRELPDEASGDASDPERAFLARQLSPPLRDALDKLPQAQREAVQLLYVEGLSVAVAAERAGVTASALKVRAHRGSRALRAALGGDAP